MINRIIAGLFVSALFAAPTAHAKSASFQVDNQTGATLTAIYSGPSSSDEWSDNILSETIANGESVTISITDLNGCEYDFKYDFSSQASFEEYKIDVCAIDGQTFTINKKK